MRAGRGRSCTAREIDLNLAVVPWVRSERAADRQDLPASSDGRGASVGFSEAHERETRDHPKRW